MKIRINETQYITLTEAAGVPTNIVEVARQIYNHIMSLLKPSIDIEDFLTNEINLIGNFKINEYNFSKVNVEFRLNNLNDYQLTDKNIKLIILGMAQRGTREIFKNYNFVSTTNPNTVNLFINLAVNNETTTQDLIDSFNKDRVVVVSSLAHELKHAYDDVKQPIIKTPERVNYDIGSEKSFGDIQPINEFLRFMYFAHTTENLVRSTELYASLEELGITREEFYKFITNSNVYREYKQGSHFTYEHLRNELLKVIPEIKNTFDHNNIVYPNHATDDEIVDFTLKQFYKTLLNWKGGVMREILTTDFFEQFIGFDDKKEEYFKKYIKRISRFGDDYEKFFKYETKQINYICHKMMKKISKIFSLIKDKNPQQ
jgi:hypothetical protein